MKIPNDPLFDDTPGKNRQRSAFPLTQTFTQTHARIQSNEENMTRDTYCLCSQRVEKA